jgi:hypothetical protein
MNPIQIEKRPTRTWALLYDGTNADEIVDWAHGNAFIDDDGLTIRTDRREVLAQPQDYIVRGLVGEYYPISPEAFAAGWTVVGEAS